MSRMLQAGRVVPLSRGLEFAGAPTATPLGHGIKDHSSNQRSGVPAPRPSKRFSRFFKSIVYELTGGWFRAFMGSAAMTIATYARINTSNQSCEMKPHELSPAAQKPAPGPFRRLTGLLGDSPYRSKPLASACPHGGRPPRSRRLQNSIQLRFFPCGVSFLIARRNQVRNHRFPPSRQRGAEIHLQPESGPRVSW